MDAGSKEFLSSQYPIIIMQSEQPLPPQENGDLKPSRGCFEICIHLSRESVLSVRIVIIVFYTMRNPGRSINIT